LGNTVKKTCKPGDLAIVISSVNESNRGLIVEVLRPHGERGKIRMKRDEPVWDVRCAVEMVWTFPGSERDPHRAKEGPVPDSSLWPIRPSPKRAKSSAKVRKEQADAQPCSK